MHRIRRRSSWGAPAGTSRTWGSAPLAPAAISSSAAPVPAQPPPNTKRPRHLSPSIDNAGVLPVIQTAVGRRRRPERGQRGGRGESAGVARRPGRAVEAEAVSVAHAQGVDVGSVCPSCFVVSPPFARVAFTEPRASALTPPVTSPRRLGSKSGAGARRLSPDA
jgi:hypothetical protein